MKYNIIGDIHGMTTWKKLVKDTYINIFVGDYFSPYPRLRKKNVNTDTVEEKHVGRKKKNDEVEDISIFGNEKKEKSGEYEVYTPTFEEQKKNFLDIVRYKKRHPDTTILLVGNHDEDHWHIREEISRHDYTHCSEISALFEKNKHFFTAAYNIEDKALVTHAGVSAFWLENVMDNVSGMRWFARVEVATDENDTVESVHVKYMDEYGEKHKFDSIIHFNKKLYRYDMEKDEYRELNYSVAEVCDKINDTWVSGEYKWFDFAHNCDRGDYYGYSKQHSPMWLRDKTLVLNNIFMYTDIRQFVGHTQHEKLLSINNIGFVDSLQFGIQSIIYDSDTNKVYKNVGKKKLIDLMDIKK